MNNAQLGVNANKPGWKENPFSLKILPQLFVGYSEELSTLVRSIENNEKVVMLIGPTGAGKTTLLKKLIETATNDYVVLYITKPPQDPAEFTGLFKTTLKPSFFDRLFSRDRITLYDLPSYATRKLKNKKMVMLIDECHEAPVDVLEWIR